MSNVERFKELLRQKEIYMNEGTNEDGSVFFRTEQKLKNGGSIGLVVAFSVEEHMVDVYGFDIAEITDPLKKESIHKLLNEINIDYRFNKFYMDNQGRISSSAALIFEDNFNPNVVFRLMVMALNTADEVYPKFMKVMWS
ncbi:YbjN domain-containing protein [Pontibacillus marinus]|uniref:YbjN domain-containing protein n=1 Tax=Pontibacillus marinus BH030004 = DSM 16465 TaxID=1385511 RepID=A0A0A5G3P8_9BACI|nr:YbjN domain-containing protein [Pontibacillus marinus]KGX86664.1 hypothetical protein N783_11755 [Pontibacillus marinus BH030004 = DSM 16465]